MEIYENNEEEWGKSKEIRKESLKKKEMRRKRLTFKLSSLCEVWKLRTKV
jgi:hypothetical protein